MGIYILTYHSLDDRNSILSISPRIFSEQMSLLHEMNVSVVPLTQIPSIKAEFYPSNHFVALTFDDGFRSIYEYGIPTLVKFGFPATIFLVTHYCGKNNSWPGQPATVMRRPLLTWEEIREMQSNGLEFGAHTLTHPDLTRISMAQAEVEIRQSKEEVENHLGEEAKMFAYPYGKSNATVQKIVGKHFMGACTTQLGKIRANSDPLSMRRVDMYYLSRPALFKQLFTKPFEWYLGFRQSLREIRGVFQ